jgi:hypothetical protein
MVRTAVEEVITGRIKNTEPIQGKTSGQQKGVVMSHTLFIW